MGHANECPNRAFVNNQFLESFDITFMGNEKTVKILFVFFPSPIKTFLKLIINECGYSLMACLCIWNSLRALVSISLKRLIKVN